MSQTVAVAADHSVNLAVPRRWAARRDPSPGIVLVARAPRATAAGFTPEIVVRTSIVDPEVSVEKWRDVAVQALAAQLDSLEVEDAETLDLEGSPVSYHRFSHRLGDVDVLCDQWAWSVDGVGVTLTGSVARADYADYCDLFEDVAATVQLTAA